MEGANSKFSRQDRTAAKKPIQRDPQANLEEGPSQTELPFEVQISEA